MKPNAAKEYLAQIGRCDAMIDCKLAEVDRLYAKATRITASMRQDGAAGSLMGENDIMAEAVARIVDLKAEINADVDRLIDLKREISATLERLKEPKHYKVLYSRYVLGMSWEAIAADMDYCARNVQIIHGIALMELNALLE